jgi:membrane-associated phospholipid phosphatase
MSRRLFAGLLTALGLAACSETSRLPAAPDFVPTVQKNAVPAEDRVTAAARWNLRTRAIIGRRGGNSNDAARVFALVSVAQYNAAIAAEEAKSRGEHPSEAGAAAAASAGVLSALYPAEQTFIASALADDATYFPTLPSERDADFATGVAVGQGVATAVLAYAANDGSTRAWTGTVPVGPGLWSLTPPATQPQQARWGEIRPWFLASGDQFRPATPPLFGSPEFLMALAEVRMFSDAPTAEQLRIARFWATEYGPGGPAGFFGTLATQLATGQHFDERRAARMLAVLHMAIMDASIGCYDAKYAYWYIRPYQADPLLKTWVTRPNFPSYPSAHSCLSAAAGGVLEAFFPLATPELRAMVEEAGLSRIYAGLHFRFEITAGQELGEAVARLAMELAPNGHQRIPLD